MNCPLAVIAPRAGSRSETFIGRHMRDLLPGGTALVVDRVLRPDGREAEWKAPLLELDPICASMPYRALGMLFRRGGGEYRGDLTAARRFLGRHGVRVIMGEFLDASLRWLELAAGMGIPLFAHAHGFDVSARLREPAWRAAYLRYSQSAGIITMSEASRTRLVGLGLDASKVHVVPYGVEVPAEPILRSAAQVVRCLAVGRMVAKKAPILTLDAFRRASLEHPGLRLDYVGEGELLPAAKQFLRAFGLDARVTLHGGRSHEDVLALMRRADLFLQHSITDPDTGDEEGLPVAILEAMACGLPIVATRHAGIPEAVLDGEQGYLVPEGDTPGMGDRLAALAGDADRRAGMGRSAWGRARDRFSWEREKSDLLRILGLAARAT